MVIRSLYDSGVLMRYIFSVLLLYSGSALAEYSNESELAYVQTGGNSEVQTTNAKTSNIYKWDLDQIKFGGHYLYGQSDEDVTARNWDVNFKYERTLSEHISVTVGEIIEGNRFTDVKARYNSDAGLKYYYVKTDPKKVFTELSFRYAIEDRYAPAGNTYDNKARFYNEIDHHVSETVRYKLWLEYVPNFTEPDDYLINGEASVTSILTSTFSLKVSYAGMYDNRPVSSELKNYDYNTTTAFVIKF